MNLFKSASEIAKKTTFVVRGIRSYTKSMSIFVKATSAKEPRTREARNIAYMYAAILIVFVLTQLFNFDEFLALLESFWLPGGVPVAYLLGSIIVVSEVLALPFLLRMKVSPLMRIVSMILGWLVSLIWLKLALWLTLTVNAVSNMGFLGTTIRLTPGWWTVLFSVALGILAAWASWGLWPIRRRK
ncbi:MAG TPA: hypothetical protein VFD55_01130 [Candidatus Angelobacter sp.]|nr:hypothetical protein [Candidatus Angelobacter sp.]